MGRRLMPLLAVVGSLLAFLPAPVASAPGGDCAACGACCCCASQPEGCGCLVEPARSVPSSLVIVGPSGPQLPATRQLGTRWLVTSRFVPLVYGPTPGPVRAHPLAGHLLLEQLALPPPA